MKIRYNEEADAFSLRFSEEEVVESDEIKDGLIIDYDSKGNPVALEILNAKEILANKPEVIVDFSSNLMSA